MFRDLCQQTPHVRSFDADAEHQFGLIIGSKQVDLCLTRSRHVDMGRLVIGSIDDKPEAVSPMNDNHMQHNPSDGFLPEDYQDGGQPAGGVDRK